MPLLEPPAFAESIYPNPAFPVVHQSTMADMDGSIIISEQLQERLLQFQADCRIYNDMLLQWYKDVRAAIRQEGYSKAEIDIILEWYIDPDVLQLVEAAKDGKRNLKERIQKKKTALQVRWGVQAVNEVEQKFGEVMSTSEAFMQALVDISAECSVATAIAGIEEQSNKRQGTKHGGISGKAMWTRRDVLLARESYRASQECLRLNGGTQEACGREDMDLENEANKMDEHSQVGVAMEQDVDMAAGPDGDRDIFSEVESNQDVQHAQGSVVGDWDDDMAQEFNVAKIRSIKRGKKRKIRRHQTGASKRVRDSSPEVEYPRGRAEALSEQVEFSDDLGPDNHIHSSQSKSKSIEFPSMDPDLDLGAFEQAKENDFPSSPPRMQLSPALQYEISVLSSPSEQKEPDQVFFDRETVGEEFSSPRLPTGDNNRPSGSPETPLASSSLSSNAFETRLFPTIKMERRRQLQPRNFRPQEKQRIPTPDASETMISRPLLSLLQAQEPQVSPDSSTANRSIAEQIRTSPGTSRVTRDRISASKNTAKVPYTTNNKRFKQILYLGVRFLSLVLPMLVLMGIIVSYIQGQYRQYRQSQQHNHGNLPRNNSFPFHHQSATVFNYALSISRLDDKAPLTATEKISPTLGLLHNFAPTRLGGYQSFLGTEDEVSTMVQAKLIPEMDRVSGTFERSVSLNSQDASSLVEVFAEEPIPDDVPNNSASDPICNVVSEVVRMSEEAASELEADSDPAINQDSDLGSEAEEMDGDAEKRDVDLDGIEVGANGRRIERTRHSNSSNSSFEINATSHSPSVKSKVGKTSHELHDQVQSGVQRTRTRKKEAAFNLNTTRGAMESFSKVQLGLMLRQLQERPPTAHRDWAGLGHWAQNISNEVHVLEMEVSNATLLLQSMIREGDKWEEMQRHVEVLQRMVPVLGDV